ncbi:MAG: AAA family ATPase [Candidatus Paceibacterota bacterium]
MYLKHLTINGFKSFAKKGELEFSAPITAIVGPNGSGKSNVAESFRFVLGEQSPSKMRGKKGEDLIWGGSDSISRSNRASVSITLDNSRKVFPLDFDEIVLERVVHRDGQNEYLINGSQVRLKDIQEVLAAANIGPSGHHIISQGEADRILSASPKERREMIEDALGLKVYQYKKSEAEKKLLKTKENIERVESLRREVAPHLRFLEKQVKKIERATELRDILCNDYAEYLKREDIFLSAEQNRLKKEITPLKETLEELDHALSKARAALETKKHDDQRDALVKAEKELSLARNKRQELLRQVGSIEGQIAFIDRRLKEANKKQSGNAVISYSEIERIITVTEKEAEKALRSDDISHLRRHIQDIVSTLRRFLSRAAENPLTNEDDEKEQDQLKSKKEELDKLLEETTKEEALGEEKYNQVRIEIEADQSESREAEREIFRIVNERREAENSLSRLQYEEEAVMRDREEFKRELQEAVALIGRAAADYLRYEIKEDMSAIIKEDRDKQRARRRELEKNKIRLEELGGANDDISKEYKNVKERDDFLVREIADLNSSVEKLELLIEDLSAQLNELFGTGVTKIGVEFGKFFALMFGGGEATLEKIKIASRRKTPEEDGEVEPMEETNAKTEEGIEIGVKLPNKRVKGLDMLSGGERALTSIALIFAMSQVNPPLFVILDETDAALDEANSRRYGDMIEALSKKSQLILITHNRETMSRAGILYGVTMGGDGISKLLSVRLQEALAVAK